MTRVRTAARTGGTLVVTLAALASSCSTATDAPRRGPPVGIVVPPPPVAPTAAPSAAAAGSERGSASAAPPPAEAAPEEPAGEPTEDMVLIPAGSFWMGCAPGDSQCRADEKPRHRVTLDAYFIDRHEVTIRDYLLCIGAKRCSDEHMFNQGIKRSVQCGWKVPGRELHPANCVNEHEASFYCKWRGKRPPTEAEWERAARGTGESRFPWGNGQPDLATCWARTDSCPVGSDPAGASPFGVLDMAGNVAEWVSDTYHPDYYARSPVRNPKGPLRPIPLAYQLCSGNCGTVRGGSWASPEGDLRSTARFYRVGAHPDIGFRCARSAVQPAPAAP